MLVLGPFVADEELGGPAAWGAILSAGAAGAVVGGLVAFKVRVRRPLVVLSLLSLSASLLLVALSVPAPVVVIAAASFVCNGCFSVDSTIWSTTLQQKIPEHAISRISSFGWFGSVALNPIGYVLVAPIAARVGVVETLAACAALNALSTVGTLLVPSVRSLDAEDEGTPAVVSALAARIRPADSRQ